MANILPKVHSCRIPLVCSFVTTALSVPVRPPPHTFHLNAKLDFAEFLPFNAFIMWKHHIRPTCPTLLLILHFYPSKLSNGQQLDLMVAKENSAFSVLLFLSDCHQRRSHLRRILQMTCPVLIFSSVCSPRLRLPPFRPCCAMTANTETSEQAIKTWHAQNTWLV